MKKGKFLSALLSLSLLLTMVPSALAAEEQDSSPIVILHTNDVHCAVEQYPAVAAQKQLMEEQYGADRVTLVDMGDSIQGSAVGTLSSGLYSVELMNQVGYDLAIPGNHEFDYGVDPFLSLARETAQFPYLCANFTGPDGELVFAPYSIVDYGDTQIAYVGVTTPEAIGSSNLFQDGQGSYVYSFQEGAGGQALYASVQTAVDGARAEGADFVVVLGHLGVLGSMPEYSSASLIANTRGIDLLLDGHSHEVLDMTVPNLDGEATPLFQTGTKLANLGRIILDPDTGRVENDPIPLGGDALPQDPVTAAQLADIQSRFDGLLSRSAGRSDFDLLAVREDGFWLVRTGETNLGDLVADAYRVQLGADVGLTNGGGVRANLPAGEITYGDLLSVLPYANEMCLVEVSGQELLDLLEHGVRTYPGVNGSFLQVSGLTFSFDPSIPSSVILSDHEDFLGINGPYRVFDVKVGGQPLELDRTYTLASHNYMIKSGGSGGTQLLDNNLLLDCVMLDCTALMDYVSQTLGGKIGPEYADPAGQGRITVGEKSEASAPQPPVSAPDTYTVQPGDCLWNIAARELRSGWRWTEIYDLNRGLLADPNRIFPGQELLLPAA